MQPKVSAWVYIDGTPICTLRTFRSAGAFGNPAAGQGTAEFIALVLVKAPAAHPESGPAEWMPILIQGDVNREAVRVPMPLIEIDQCVDIPTIQQLISG